MTTPELYSGSQSNFGSIIFLVIFFGIIVVLIIVASIGSRRDKNEKLVENDKIKKIRQSAEENRIAIFVTLDRLINELKKDLKDFKPSVGTKSLGDINNDASSIIKKIAGSKELKEVYASEDFKLELKPIIDELNKSKPSTWDKEALFALSIIPAKLKAIKADKKNAPLIKLGEKKKWK